MLHELENKNLSFDDRFYVLKSPMDPSLSASQAYRSVLSGAFDLVLVENGYPLEPNYVIIEDIYQDINYLEVKTWNLERAGIAQESVLVEKLEGVMKTYALLFDFREKQSTMERFAEELQEKGLVVGKEEGDVMVCESRRHQLYKWLFRAYRDRERRYVRQEAWPRAEEQATLFREEEEEKKEEPVLEQEKVVEGEHIDTVSWGRDTVT